MHATTVVPTFQLVLDHIDKTIFDLIADIHTLARQGQLNRRDRDEVGEIVEQLAEIVFHFSSWGRQEDEPLTLKQMSQASPGELKRAQLRRRQKQARSL